MRDIYKVLVHAKEKNKWVLVRHLVPYGLSTGIIELMESRGHIFTRNTEQGTVIKLTLLGYKSIKGGIAS